MKLFDIVPETPSINLDPPKLRYVVISVNDQMPVVVENGMTINVAPKDIVMITHVETNYNRGVVADIIGYGTVNDIKKKIRIKKSTMIRVRKDHYVCGSVNISMDRRKRVKKVYQDNKPYLSDHLFFKVKINGQENYYQNYSRVTLVKGDTIEISDVMGNINSEELRVNFKGFVGNPKDNTGEDRGYVIRTDSDLQNRYSMNRDGRMFPVIASVDNKTIGKLFVEIEQPFLAYVVFQIKNKDKRCLAPGESILINHFETMELLDFKTNIQSNKDVQVFINGPDSKYLVRPKTNIDWNSIRDDSKGATQRYRVDIQRDSLLMGSVYVYIDRSRAPNAKLTKPKKYFVE